MSIPKRNASPSAIESTLRTFHVTSSTAGKRGVFQMEAMARLLIDILFHYRNQGIYQLHAFVVMRDHFHALLTIDGMGTIEDAVRRIKGGFSYRAKRELSFTREIWQRGFTDERIWDAEQFCTARAYIHNNPVRKRIVFNPEDYPFSSAHPRYRKPRGLKPEIK